MTQLQTEQLKSKLVEQLRRLTRPELAGAEAAVHADPTDQATVETERHFELRLSERSRGLAAKIHEALRRIEDGTYGLCEDCDSPIGDRRLEARPVTTLCVECKTAQEREEQRQQVA